jgi:hypothetical protein
MQDVTVTFTDGLLKGRVFDFEVGRVVIGRQPGERGLELKGADGSVSRLHAELVEKGGDIELKNLSPNGTLVNGKLLLDEMLIASGALIEIGEKHSFKVHWSSVGATQVLAAKAVREKKAAPRSAGPLASPIVRAVLGVYIIGILGVAVWLGFDSTDVAVDEWPALSAAYDDYEDPRSSPDAKQARAARAEALMRQLRVLKVQGEGRAMEPICRELMSLDGDAKSPLFRYGARCLGEAQGSVR